MFKFIFKSLMTSSFISMMLTSYALDASAFLPRLCRLACLEFVEAQRAVPLRSLAQRFISSRKSAAQTLEEGRSFSDEVEREIEALGRSHNPTGERYPKIPPAHYVLYPEWDLASTERSVSRKFDVVTGVQSVPDVGVVGTLKKSNKF